MGPIEIAVFSFPGSRFNGQVAPALRELVDSGTVRLLDLAFVTKDADGDVAWFELEAVGGIAPEFAELGAEPIDLLNEEDIALLAEEVAPGSSAAIVVWEHTWAARLAEAVRDSEGFIVTREHIPMPIVEAAIAAARTA